MRNTLTAAALCACALASGQEPRGGLRIWFDKPTSLDGRTVWWGGNPEMWDAESKPESAGDQIANPDREWERASLPIGNGSIGANIMGSVEAERLTLNEKTLWRGGPNTELGAEYYWDVNKEAALVLPDIRRAFAEGDDALAARLTRENFNSTAAYESAAERPFRFGNFTTMGEVYVETGLSVIGMSGYRRGLSLDSAVATVGFRKDGAAHERLFFASYPDNALVMRFRADKPGRQNLTLSYAPNPVSTGRMEPDGEGGMAWTARLDNNGMEHVVRFRAVAAGGRVAYEDGRLRVEGADEATFIVCADTDYAPNFSPDFTDAKAYVGVDPKATTAEWARRAAEAGFDKLLSAHVADYKSLFDRVRLRLNDGGGGADVPTPQRLANYRKGMADNHLETLYYQFGRYLLIASSRPGNMPANLQGLWHNNVDGPWRVDYHNNINIQMNYWPACATNLSECALPLVDFVRTLVKPGERVARAYFGAGGWTASISANIFGFASPLASQEMSWNFSPMAGPWLATHVWEYYDYTRDAEFLRTVGYDLIRGAATFAADHLWRKPDGTYTAAPSTSPEHGPVDQGATFAHAVVREILLDAIDASKALGADKAERKRWEGVLGRLAPYAVGRYGQLMEWSKDIDDPLDQHRHVNHLFGLHPGRTLSPITTPELARASRVVLEHRGDGATGWSMGWKLCQWARLHDGNHAYTLFGNLLKSGTLDNLWDTHPPFQIDGNFGGTAGVTEMLLQSHMGFVHLLPALPDAWAEGRVSGLCARGNFELSMEWRDGALTRADITSKSGGPLTVRYGDSTVSIKTKKGEAYRLVCSGGKLVREK